MLCFPFSFHTTVRDLGVTLDSALTFSQHISNLTRSSYFQLRRLRTIRKAVSVLIFISIVHAFVCSRIDYCNSLLIGLPKTRLSPLQTVLNAAARFIARLPRYSHIPYYTSRNISIGFQSLLVLNIKFCLLFLRPKWGWHLNIFVMPSDFRPLPHPFVLYAPWTGGSFYFLGLGQPWPCLDLLPLLRLLFGIAFHLQVVLLSYRPIFLRPYHYLKLVSFLGANRIKSASVCLWLLRGVI